MRTTQSLRRFSTLVCLASMALFAGCEPNPAEAIRDLQQRNDDLKAQLQTCEQSSVDQEAAINELGQQLANRKFTQDISLDDLFLVEGIKLASLTRGADFDDKPGDDGVTVYLRPTDAAGDTIKAAGRISVQVLDLGSGENDPAVLARCVYEDPHQIRELWYGGMMTNHYTLKCPFNDGQRPSGKEVLLRVQFLDWLTGKTFSVAQTVPVDMTPGANAEDAGSRETTAPAAEASTNAVKTDAPTSTE